MRSGGRRWGRLWRRRALRRLLCPWSLFCGHGLHESDLSQKAATNSLPLQDAFAVLFFVSVGMLFDPSILVREPLMVAAVLLLIVIGKSLVALGIVLALVIR
jgi:monovalent cation:H+ antiporter-2, CPA2 family